jgi:hypothetical protein
LSANTERAHHGNYHEKGRKIVLKKKAIKV